MFHVRLFDSLYSLANGMNNSMDTVYLCAVCASVLLPLKLPPPFCYGHSPSHPPPKIARHKYRLNAFACIKQIGNVHFGCV